MKRRVVVSGIGSLSAAGAGVKALDGALESGAQLARPERIDLGGDEWIRVRVARLPDLDRSAHLSPAQRRRMSQLSQDWVIACLLARSDARLDADGAMPAPERRAICLGTAFGGLESTAVYLEGLQRDGLGLGNPFLFSESVANAPAGHAAIALDCRGLNISLTCGDSSGVAAVDCGARAIRDGRADLAMAGGVESMTPLLLAVLARIGAVPVEEGIWKRRAPHAPAAAKDGSRAGAGRGPIPLRPPGDGSVCLVLEERERALSRGASPYAEIHPARMAADPEAGEAEWSRSVPVRAEALSAALREAGVAPGDLSGAVLHRCGEPAAERAETEALLRGVGAERKPGVPLLLLEPSQVVGTFAAAGAFGVAAAALALRSAERRHFLLSAASWGGSCLGMVLSGPGA